MREYEVTVTERMISCVQVEADNDDEAYAKAMKLLAEDFDAPYHEVIDVIDYEVELIRDDDEIQEGE